MARRRVHLCGGQRTRLCVAPPLLRARAPCACACANAATGCVAPKIDGSAVASTSTYILTSFTAPFAAYSSPSAW